jgi:hypothetical protein
MNNFGLAVWYGVKDFWNRQIDHSDYVKVKKQLKWYEFDDLCLLTVLAGAHQHTFGVPGSILQAIREGRWKYHDLKAIQAEAPSVFANSGMSPEGQKLVLKMMQQGKGVAAQRFSEKDSKLLTSIIMKFHDQADIARDHVNF